MRKKKTEPVDARLWRHLASNALVLDDWAELLRKRAAQMKRRHYFCWQRENMLREMQDVRRSTLIVLRSARRLRKKFDKGVRHG